MDQRLAFVTIYQRGALTMTELSDDFNVSRKTAYKWVERYREAGSDGLRDRRRTPHTHPTRLPDEVLERCVQLKLEKPTWGPKKLVALGQMRDPGAYWPAPSTLGEHLKRLGMTKPRRWRNRKTPPYQDDFLEARQANDVWSADFKGHFKTRNRQYCYPLTVIDTQSRFLLCCRALPDTGGAGTKPEFERLFEHYGLPRAIRTDNGPPFATLRLGFSHLSLWWRRLGIVHERIDPGHPEQNGRHERMHKTMKAEATRPPKRDLQEQQQRFDQWREEFNQERPHEALAQTTPASHYEPSPRPYPKELPEVSYPPDFQVRRVRQAGEILWRNRRLYMTTILINELIGLQQIDEDQWRIWFADLPIGILDERLKKVLPMSPV